MTASYYFSPNLLDQIKEIPPDSIISQTFFSGDQTKAILFGFAPGQELSEHTASRPSVLHFLEGTARISLGGDTFKVGPGAWVHMPAQMAHSIHAETRLVMLLMLL